MPAAATALGVGVGVSCAALADGTARCWGMGYSGQLGNGANAVIAPTLQSLLHNIVH